MLKVKLLEAGAKAPICSRPSEDLGYDVFALEDTVLYPHVVTKVRTGVAVAAYQKFALHDHPLGLLIRDRSSMAAKGITVSGGVIDAGYRGEIIVLLTKSGGGSYAEPYMPVPVKAGDKIAQLVPVPVLTGETVVVAELKEADRGEKNFGSSGR